MALARRRRTPSQVSAEDEVLLGVEHGDVARAMDRLSPELLAVVQATVLDGLTTREAARVLGHPDGDRQESDVAGRDADEGGVDMTWHVDRDLLAGTRAVAWAGPRRRRSRRT